jgi:hypothetical protein
MVRLLLAIVLGVVLAVAATVVASRTLVGVANGTASNSSLYQYGNR